MWTCVSVFVCVCMCVLVRAFVVCCACVCACVWKWACVCGVCACVFGCVSGLCDLSRQRRVGRLRTPQVAERLGRVELHVEVGARVSRGSVRGTGELAGGLALACMWRAAFALAGACHEAVCSRSQRVEETTGRVVQYVEASCA